MAQSLMNSTFVCRMERTFFEAACDSRMCSLTQAVYRAVESSREVADLQAGDSDPQSNTCRCCRHQQRPRLPVPAETAQLPG